MPQLDPSVFPTQLFWLVLTFIPLYLVFLKVGLPKVSAVREARRRKIGGDLEKAEALKAEAETALADYEKTIAEATARAQASVREAALKAAEDETRQRAELAARLAEEVAAAEARIAEEKQRAIGEIGAVAVELAQIAVDRLTKIAVDEDETRAAVDAALGESAGGNG